MLNVCSKVASTILSVVLVDFLAIVIHSCEDMHTLFRQLAHSCRSFAAVHQVSFPRIRGVTCSLDAPSVNFHNIILRRMGSSDTTKRPDFVKDVVALEELDTDLYISHSAWKAGTARAMFGGQIIVQALASGNMTMVPGLNLHSMHCYFLRPGDVNRSTVYRVNRTRDGSSFSSRSISAMQKGRPILTLQASYHNEIAETSNLKEYQPQQPDVKHHSELKTTKEYLEDYLKKPDVSDKLKALLSKSLEIYNDLPVEIKPLDAAAYMRQKRNPENKITAWIRVTGDLGMY